MVDADIQKAQQELITRRQEAQKIAGQKIPQRRFGVAVTPELQRRIVEQRRTAQSTLKNIEVRQEELKDIQASRDAIAKARGAEAKIQEIIQVRRSTGRTPDIRDLTDAQQKRIRAAFKQITAREDISGAIFGADIRARRRGEAQTVAAVGDISIEPAQVLQSVSPTIRPRTSLETFKALPGILKKRVIPVVFGKVGEAPPPAGAKQVISGLKKAQDFLDQSIVDTREKIIPELKEQRLEGEQLVKDQEALAKRIETFNNDLKAEKLTKEQATVQGTSLRTEQQELFRKAEDLKERVEAPVTEIKGVGQRIGAGFVTAIPVIGSIGIGALIAPEKVAEQVLVETPEAFIRDPFGTGAEIAGQLAFFNIVGAVFPGRRGGRARRPSLKEKTKILEGLPDIPLIPFRPPIPPRPPRPPRPSVPDIPVLTTIETATRGRLAAIEFATELTRLEPRAIARTKAAQEAAAQRRIERAIEERLREQSTLALRTIEPVTAIAERRARTLTEAERRIVKATQARITAAEVSRRLGILEPRRLSLLRAKELTKTETKAARAKERIEEATRTRLLLGELEFPVFEAPKIAKKRAAELKKRSEAERIKEAKRRGAADIKPSEILSEGEIRQLGTQLKAQQRADPTRLLPQAQKQTLLQIQKPKKLSKEVKPLFDIKVPTITNLQLATLGKLKAKPKKPRSLNLVRPDSIVALESLTKIRKRQTKAESLRARLLERELEGSFTQRRQLRRQELELQSQLDFTKVRSTRLLEVQKFRKKSRQKQLFLARSGFATLEGQRFAEAQINAFQQSFRTPEATKFASATALAIGELTSLRERPIVKTRLREVTLPKTKPFLFAAKRRRRVKPKLKKRQAYNAFAKPQGKKNFVKLNQVPLAKEKAKDTMAFFVDKSLSASGKIRTTKGKPKPASLKIPSNYFGATKNKFREFKIRKGKKIATPNDFIEKRGFRLDSVGEKKSINLASLLSTKKAQARKKKSKGRKK